MIAAAIWQSRSSRHGTRFGESHLARLKWRWGLGALRVAGGADVADRLPGADHLPRSHALGEVVKAGAVGLETVGFSRR